MTEPKTILTLLEDINSVFTNPTHKVNPDNLKKLTESLSRVVTEQLEKSGQKKDTKLRMSNLGLPDRKLYLDIKHPVPEGQTTAQEEMRFLYGGVIEQLLIFLIREAGHYVTHEQLEVIVDGVVGHIDFAVDNVVTDSKSVSPYQFSKFKSTYNLKQNDSFGYVTQLGGYHEALKNVAGIDKEKAAIIAQNKSDGQTQLLLFDEMELPNIPQRIKDVKEMLNKDTLPPLCYTPTPDPKTGNSELPKGCAWCRHKFGCHPTLRAFKYAQGVKYFTNVVSTPRVEELKIEKAKEVEPKIEAIEEASTED